MILSGGQGAWWAWVACEVTSASDLTADRSYSNLDEVGRLRKALGEQQAWLSTLVSDTAVVIENRWIWNPDSRQLRVALLARAFDTSPEGATRRGEFARERIRAAPSHVVVDELPDEEIPHLLEPFQPDPAGIAEIRKRVSTGRPNRPDAGMALYWMPNPYRVSVTDWVSLMHQLSRLKEPLAVSVALQPMGADPNLGPGLDRMATVFSRLAKDGEMPGTGLYGGSLKLSPDPFAVNAAKVYADLARRYRGGLFRSRVAVASPRPLDDGILNLIGSTLSPNDDTQGETALTRESTGQAFRVVRPRDAGEAAAMQQNFGSMEPASLPDKVPPEPFARLAHLTTLVDVVEASGVFRLPIAATGVLPAFPVRRPSFAVRVEVAQHQRSLALGTQIVDGRAEDLVAIPLDDLTMHGFVVGTTGSGKTSTVIGLCDQLWRTHHVPFLVIEPVNSSGDDYRWFLERAGFEDAVVLEAGSDGVAPLRLNPFEVPARVRVGEHLGNLLSAFDAAFGLWDPLPAIYRTALERTYLEAGWTLDDTGGPEASWPTLESFIEEMRTATENLDYAGEVRSNIIAASRVRVEQLRTGPARSVFDCHRSTPLAELLDRPTIIELARIGSSNEQELALVMAMLLNAIAEHRRAAAPSRTLTHVIVVEEAHKLLRNPEPRGGEAKGDAGGAAARLFANLLAEIRKYGEGLLIADQDPAKLVSDAHKNTNLKIMHRLPHEDDRRLVGAGMRFEDDHIREAASLARFHAFAHAEGFDRPALVRFDNVRAADARELPGDDVLRERFMSLRAKSAGVEASVRPYGECQPCRHACAFRAKGAAAASTRKARAGLEALIQLWDPSAPDVYRSEWWNHLRWAVGQLAPTTASEDVARDLHACVFMHFLRDRYTTGRDPWMAQFRSDAAAADPSRTRPQLPSDPQQAPALS